MSRDPINPLPLDLGARVDYIAKIATRQVVALADGAALVIEIGGEPLKLRRAGDAFILTAPGEPSRVLSADDLAAVIWAGMLAHVGIQAATFAPLSRYPAPAIEAAGPAAKASPLAGAYAAAPGPILAAVDADHGQCSTAPTGPPTGRPRGRRKAGPDGLTDAGGLTRDTAG